MPVVFSLLVACPGLVSGPIPARLLEPSLTAATAQMTVPRDASLTLHAARIELDSERGVFTLTGDPTITADNGPRIALPGARIRIRRLTGTRRVLELHPHPGGAQETARPGSFRGPLLILSRDPAVGPPGLRGSTQFVTVRGRKGEPGWQVISDLPRAHPAAGATEPVPITLLIPAGVEITFSADSQEYTEATREYFMQGKVQIRLSNGVELRMDRARVRLPEGDDSKKERPLVIEAE